MAHVTRADAARIDEVASLWKELHAHHASGAQRLGEVRRFRSSEDSWQIRRAQYLEYFASALPAALILAEHAGAVVSYAMARALPAGPTLETSDTIGHLESLAVLPGYRSAGVGRQLLDAAWAWCHSAPRWLAGSDEAGTHSACPAHLVERPLVPGLVLSRSCQRPARAVVA